MEQNKNFESPGLSEAEGPRGSHEPSGGHWWEEWGGQDSSIPEEPWEPDAMDLLLHPELAEGRTVEDRAGVDRAGAELERPAGDEPPQHRLPGVASPQPAPDDALPPEVAEARRRQGLTGPPKRTGTGFFYRNGDEIPPTHPDHGPMHLLPRQHDGSFAAYYYCSKQELAAARIDAPQPPRHRRDGFSPERQEAFVRHLRGTASWTDAARLTGISRSTAYNLYNSPDAAGFRAAVDEALKCTDGLLEATALERAIKGHEEIVYYQGRRVGVRWKADNRLLMSLLRARNPLKYAPLNEIEGWLRRRGLALPADLDGALDRLHAAEAEWGRRLPGEGDPPALEAAPPAISADPEQGSSEVGSRVEGPVHASTSSTLASEQPRQASISSTSGDESPPQASTSSTSAADAVPAPGVPRPFRPPPRPRIRLA